LKAVRVFVEAEARCWKNLEAKSDAYDFPWAESESN